METTSLIVKEDHADLIRENGAEAWTRLLFSDWAETRKSFQTLKYFQIQSPQTRQTAHQENA